MKHIRNILHILETRLLLVTTLFSTGYMQMEAMSSVKSYTVWAGDRYGDFVKADDVLIIGDTVSFRLNGKEVKKYNKKEFLLNNPEWKLLENSE